VDVGRAVSTAVLMIKEEEQKASIARLNRVVSDATIVVVGGFAPMARVEEPVRVCFVLHPRSVPVEEEEVGVELAEYHRVVAETFCRLLHKIVVECSYWINHPNDHVEE
jgi:hypothetical protein